MGAGKSDLFGVTRAEPATPGSYGEAPAGYRLPDATRLGQVRVQVSDLERSLRFYEQTLGLPILERAQTRASLGPADGRVLVELVERKGARPAGRGLLGLYHFAILLPDRASLGRFVRHLGDMKTRVGSADHLVSEALYLTHPDGLGIEAYADRPRSTWQRIGRELMIATDPADIEGLLQATGDERWRRMPEGTVIGHVHLHVGDLAEDGDFFSEAIGFDRMTWRYPGALFMGAGGYHHHLGTNTWAGPSARAPREDDARLLEWSIELPSADVAAMTESLARAGYRTEKSGSDTLAWDPWGTAVRLRAL